MKKQTGVRTELRVGFLLDSLKVSPYVEEISAWITQQAGMKLAQGVVLAAPMRGSGFVARAIAVFRRRGWLGLVGALSFRALLGLENFLLARGPHRDHLSVSEWKAPGIPILRLRTQMEKGGFGQKLSSADSRRVRALGVDVWIRWNSAFLREGILEAARFGVLSFHHGDNRINRGGPAGFWEVYQRCSQTGFVIQRLTEELDGGQVLFRGLLPTQPFFLLNQAHLYRVSNHYLKNILRQLARHRRLPEPLPSQPYSEMLFRRPTLLEQSIYVFRQLHYLVRRLTRRLVLGRRERWGVAFLREDWAAMVMRRAQRIPNPPGTFLADPFLVRHGREEWAFMEEFVYATGRGRIVAYRLGRDTAERHGIVLEEPFHLSFPFVFRCDGRLYLVPESAGQKEVRLYECENFPGRWRLKKILLRGLAMTDTMIFPHRNRWWMLVNADPSGAGDRGSELRLYLSRHPLRGDWREHPANPILLDSQRARNGGLLFRDGVWFRVSQRHGFHCYGTGFQIHRINRITPSVYQEEPIAQVEPRFFPRLTGTHHLHGDGRLCLFDFKTVTGWRGRN